MSEAIEVLDETPGTGAAAQRGDVVEFDCAVRLDGRVVQARAPQRAWIGSRRIVPGVSMGLLGMRAGGYRRIRVPPHLAVGSGAPKRRLSGGSLLEYELWLTSLHQTVAEV